MWKSVDGGVTWTRLSLPGARFNTVPMEVTDMTATDDPRLELSHIDLNVQLVSFSWILISMVAWIGNITGDTPDHAIVALRCKKLTLAGDLVAVEAVLADWTALLADVRTRRDDWDQLLSRSRRMGADSLRFSPHPFTRRAGGLPLPTGPVVTARE